MCIRDRLDTIKRTWWSLGSCSRIKHHPKKNDASMRCFILSRLTYAVVKVLLELQTDCSVWAQHLINQSQIQSSAFGMTGSWGLPADTSKSHSNRAQLQKIGDGNQVRSVEVRRLELLTSCLQSRRARSRAVQRGCPCSSAHHKKQRINPNTKTDYHNWPGIGNYI